MKELSLEHKNAIRDALSAYCDNYLSRNRAAESLNGVSAATVSTIVNSKYTNISDDMFIRIATQIDRIQFRLLGDSRKRSLQRNILHDD